MSSTSFPVFSPIVKLPSFIIAVPSGFSIVPTFSLSPLPIIVTFEPSPILIGVSIVIVLSPKSIVTSLSITISPVSFTASITLIVSPLSAPSTAS